MSSLFRFGFYLGSIRVVCWILCGSNVGFIYVFVFFMFGFDLASVYGLFSVLCFGL